MEVKQVSETRFEVKSSESDTWHEVFVDRGKASCTCSDFVFRGKARPCKHIRSVFRVATFA